MNNTKRKVQKKDETKSDVLQRLAQASVEGLIVNMALNALLPGAGTALGSVNQTQSLKKMGKVMGKSAAQEGIQMLDEEEPEETNSTGNLQEKMGLEVLDRMRGRG